MERLITFTRGIRYKLLVTMLGLIVGVLTVQTWIEVSSNQRFIKREMERRIALKRDVLIARGEATAGQLATEVGNHLAGFAISSVAEAVTNATRLNSGLRYAIVMNRQAQTLVHVGERGAVVHFDNGELKQYTGDDDRFAAGQSTEISRDVKLVEATVLEVIAPIRVGNDLWGVLRLGFSVDELQKEITSTRSEMAAQARNVVIRSLLTAAGVVFVGTLVVAWLSGLISRPITHLTATARQLATGDFAAAQRIHVRSKDEVGLLADAFATMVGNLQRTYAEIEESNRTLERKVAERTRELAHMSEQAEEARDAAESANRTKSSFLASISHELRTPLTAIIGFSEMLLADAQAEGRAEAADDLQRVMDSARHLLGLINEILDLSKIEAQKMDLHLERFELARLVREVTDTIRPLTKKNSNQLVVQAAPDLGAMHADITKLRQSLLNLLSNANKFTLRGEVRLEISRVTREDGEFLRFVVRDTGIGMTSEQMSRLFQAFHQADSSTSRKYGGTGLGLVITKKYCEMMGGRIAVESEHGRGSTFTLDVPAHVKELEAKPDFPARPTLAPQPRA